MKLTALYFALLFVPALSLHLANQSRVSPVSPKLNNKQNEKQVQDVRKTRSLTYDPSKTLVAAWSASKDEKTACRDDTWKKKQDCNVPYKCEEYRIGDAFYHPADWNLRQLHPFIKRTFPGSIGAQFVEKVAHGIARDQAMLDVIGSQQYDDFEKPRGDTLIVHMRIGDVLRNTSKTLPQRRWLGEKYYSPKVALAVARGVTTAVFVTGFDTFDTKSGLSADQMKDVQKRMKGKMGYLSEVFKKAGMKNVFYRVNMNTDCDLYYMANAKHYVAAGGLYSRLLTQLVTTKGGEVYKDGDKPAQPLLGNVTRNVPSNRGGH